MSLEAALMWAVTLGAPALLVCQAAKGWPQRMGRIGYLIAFPVLLFVDLPILMALYVTPKRSSAFEVVHLASEIALLFIPMAFGCLLSGILYRKLQKEA